MMTGRIGGLNVLSRLVYRITEADRHLFDNRCRGRVIVVIVDQLPEGMLWHVEN